MECKSLLKMNQQRIYTALTTRCKCCLRERPTRDLWSEHFVHGEMENYGVMLQNLCCIPWPEDGSETERICYPCIARLRDAVDFLKQVEVAQSFVKELMDGEDSDVEIKMDLFLERHLNNFASVPSQLKRMKMEVDEEQDEDSSGSYTEIEYLEVDGIEDTKNISKSSQIKTYKKATEQKKKAPVFVVLGNTVIQKVAKSESVSDPDNNDDSLHNKSGLMIPMPKIERLEDDEEPETPNRRTKPVNSERAVVSGVSVSAKSNEPLKVITEVKRKYKTPNYNYVPVPPEENKHLQLKLERQRLQDNLIALLLSTNATPIKLKHDTGYRCGFCEDVYVNAADLKKHTIECHTDDEKGKYLADIEMHCFIVKLDITNHRCNICGESLDDYEGVWQHLKDHGVNVHLNIKNQIIPYKLNDDGIYRCFMCQMEFVYFRAISMHMNSHLRNYVCESCGSGFLTKRGMLLHARLHTKGDYKCQYCDKYFSVKFKLKMHERNMHIKRKVNNVCGFCGEKFSDHNTKARHLESEHGIKRTLYQCDSCDKVLTNRRTLKSHIENVHYKLKKYQCPICQKECYDKSNIQKHIVNKHHNQKHLVCSICNKVFSQLKALQRHQRMHQKDKNFICKICHDHFEKKSGLLAHLRARHEILNARDNLADFVETDIDLEVSVAVDKDVDYECLICQLKCGDKDKMMFHLKTAHGVSKENFEEFVNVCNVCNDDDE